MKKAISSYISSLTPYKKTYAPDHFLCEVRSKLEDLGLSYVGEGAYSIVFRHPEHDDQVLKITLSLRDPYPEFTKWLRVNSSIFDLFRLQKHFPKIHSTKVYRNGVVVTVLEKLEPRPTQSRSGNKTYQKVIKILGGVGHALGFSIDIHDRNVMYRGRTPVVIDPWSHREN